MLLIRSAGKKLGILRLHQSSASVHSGSAQDDTVKGIGAVGVTGTGYQRSLPGFESDPYNF
jgi:hypothetical protein